MSNSEYGTPIAFSPDQQSRRLFFAGEGLDQGPEASPELGVTIMNTRHAFKPSTSTELESREVLSQLGLIAFPHVPMIPPCMPPVVATTLPIHPSIVSTAAADTSARAKAGSILNDVYQMFTTNGGKTEAIKAKYPFLQISGTSISISVRATSAAAVGSLQNALVNLGARIQATSTTYATISAYVPISSLATIAAIPQTFSMQANSRESFSEWVHDCSADTLYGMSSRANIPLRGMPRR